MPAPRPNTKGALSPESHERPLSRATTRPGSPTCYGPSRPAAGCPRSRGAHPARCRGARRQRRRRGQQGHQHLRPAAAKHGAGHLSRSTSSRKTASKPRPGTRGQRPGRRLRWSSLHRPPNTAWFEYERFASGTCERPTRSSSGGWPAAVGSQDCPAQSCSGRCATASCAAPDRSVPAGATANTAWSPICSPLSPGRPHRSPSTPACSGPAGPCPASSPKSGTPPALALDTCAPLPAPPRPRPRRPHVRMAAAPRVKSKGAQPKVRRCGGVCVDLVLEWRRCPGTRGPPWLLPRLIRDRTRGQVFSTHRRWGLGKMLSVRDVCPNTSPVRLSHGQAHALRPGAGRPFRRRSACPVVASRALKGRSLGGGRLCSGTACWSYRTVPVVLSRRS